MPATGPRPQEETATVGLAEGEDDRGAVEIRENRCGVFAEEKRVLACGTA